MKTSRNSVIAAGVALLIAGGAALAAPMGTAFTYQGQLKDGGAPVSGPCDFEFSLWTASSGGSPIGPLLSMTVPAGEMNDGLFTVTLDFEEGAFDGDARWLEIAVSCSPSDPFVTLGRQELTPAPNASYASTAGGAETAATTPWTGLSGVPAGFDDDVDNDLLAQTDCANGQVLKWNGAGGDWACAEDTAGGGSLWQPDGSDIYYNNGNVGIGTTDPDDTLDVDGTIRVGSPAGGGDWTFTSTSIGDLYLSDPETGSNVVVVKNGAPETIRISGDGKVGIGTGAPLAPLHLEHVNVLLSSDAVTSGENLVIESTNAGIGMYSDSGGAWGSQLNFGEVDAGGNLQDKWTLMRRTSGSSGGSSLRLLYGPDADPAINDVIMHFAPDGNVGIGTTEPLSPLSFASELGDKIRLWGSGDLHYGLGIQSGLLQIHTLSENSHIAFGYGSSGDFTETMRVKGNGRVGIGTHDPASRLHVKGDRATFTLQDDDDLTSRTRIIDVAPTQLRILKDTTLGESLVDVSPNPLDGTSPASFRVFRETNTGGVKRAVFHRGNNTTQTSAVIGVDGADSYFQAHGGKVGIGTTAPNTTLHVRAPSWNTLTVEASTNDPALQLTSDGSSIINDWTMRLDADASDKLQFRYDNSAKMTMTIDGDVGIGISNPGAKLDVNGNVKVYGRTVYTNGTGPLMTAGHNNISDKRMWIGHSENYPNWGIQYRDRGSDGLPADSIEFVAGDTAKPTMSFHAPSGVMKLYNIHGEETIRLDPDFGAGREGRIRTEVLEITGADLAEKFPVTEEVQPGLVMQIDPDHPGKLRLARGAYNRCVAGVVSGANGLSVGVVLGNLPGQEDAPPIAMSGRVWVHCDASNGAIVPGDLLTTSDTTGHAMKVIDYPKAQGAIIGKAMTPLAEGKGLVLVLVSLQ